MVTKAIRSFFEHEATAGVLLFLSAVVAMVIQNTGGADWYEGLVRLPVAVRFGSLALEKPLELWINDGLMAIFFLLVGMEIKREMVLGELSRWRQRILPGLAALGGMIGPALLYAVFNYSDSQAMRGWAIPCATDIAFSLGVLAVLGSRVPIALKVFLTALAIIDDLGAILIIAFFYTAHLKIHFLVYAAGILSVLVALNRFGVRSLVPYILLGVALWLFVLKSGVHATIAGVILGFCIPLRTSSEGGTSPLLYLEHALHPWVAYVILPIFAFANGGVNLHGIGLGALLDPVTLGIACGLFFGKQIGIFTSSLVCIKLRLAEAPHGSSWLHLYGVSIVAGIGFTMSLFIGGLAFNDHLLLVETRLGVLGGSLVSALVGLVVLRTASTSRTGAKSKGTP